MADEKGGSALLGDKDLPAVRVFAPGASSPFLLIGDHAGAAIPQALGTLGLSAHARARHIALDIGVQALGEALSEALGATFIAQRYSRLVIDCNRHPDSEEAIAAISDGTAVPGNVDLTGDERAQRIDEIHAPYHRAIADCLAQRDARGQRTILVALHSFTPIMGGIARPWEAGVLHDGHADVFALAVRDGLRAAGDLTIGDNEPYRMDATDYTVPCHAFAQDRPYLELEVRQDLLASDADVRRWRDRLAAIFQAAA